MSLVVLDTLPEPDTHSEIETATLAWLASKAKNTRSAYRRELATWLSYCHARGIDPLAARKPDVDLFIAASTQALTPASKARRISALSSWYRYLIACELTDRNPCAHAERPKVDRDFSATPWLDEENARRLIEAVERRACRHRYRNIAMVRLMLELGIRVSEVCSLRTDAFHELAGHLVVRVRGKGGKLIDRVVPPTAAAAINAYRAHVPHEGFLFLSANGGPVHRDSVREVVHRAARDAGIKEAIGPHGLRHTFATLATEQGADLDDLQDAMGHADPRTTRRYQRAARRLKRDPALLVAAALG